MARSASHRRTGGRRAKRRSSASAIRLRYETLERRFLLASRLMISEVVADNDGSFLDADGNASDWIEIHNAGDVPVDLTDWNLTDDRDRPTKWSFPSVMLDPREYRVVFASGCEVPGEDCPDTTTELHANFRIDADGSYLALVEPDGTTIAHELAVPRQVSGLSFGDALVPRDESLLDFDATGTLLVPRDDSLGDSWTGAAAEEPFDDSAAAGWIAGESGFGFESRTAGPRPVAYWNFDDHANGATALDSSGNSRHGIIRGASYTADRSGHSARVGDRALDFGAVDNGAHVDVTSAGAGAFDSLVDNDSFTISLWVFGNAGQPGNDTVFYASNDVDGSGTRSINAHVPWGDGTIYFDTGSPSNCCGPASRISIPEPDASTWRGRWNHYAFIKNGDVKEIWQNGELLLRGTNTNDLQPIRSFVIGVGANKANWGYGGLIDDVAVWDRPLDALQVAAIAAGSSPLEIGRYRSLIGTDVEQSMRGINASAYLRFPFEIASPDDIDFLALRMRHDDGFVAYLNGTEILRENAEAGPSFDAHAIEDRAAPEVLVPSRYDVSSRIDLLRPGTNVLAVHGLNSSADDEEFLIAPQLLAGTSLPDRYLVRPTPGRPNACWLDMESTAACESSPGGYVGLVGDTKFDVDRGYFDSPLDVRITSSTPGASIVYTTDGSSPSTDNAAATVVDSAGPDSTPVATIPIDRTTVLRATAVKPEHRPANVDSHTYLFVADIANQPDIDPDVVSRTLPGYGFGDALLSIPTISITADPDDLWSASRGIMTHPTAKGPEWERAASVEFIDPNGSDAFQIDFGLRIHGGISRNDSFSYKRSFRLFFRQQYGQGKLDFPLFSDSSVTRFDQLVLKASSTDSWAAVEWPITNEGYFRWQRHQASYVRDQWIRDTQTAVGQVGTHGRFVHVFLNGRYWGQYGLTERPIDSFQSQYFGGEEEQYDVVHDCPQECGLQAGDFEAWDAMMDLASRGLVTNAAYQRIQGNHPDGTPHPDYPTYIDIDNFIDYIIPHVAFGADDYPAHNWWAARRHGIEEGLPRSEGFRFFIWDQEISNTSWEKMRNSSGETLYEQISTSNSPALLYDRLRRNPEFQRRFADRVHELFFNDGAFTPENNRARWKARSGEIDQAIVAESARWGDSRRLQPYLREVEWLAHERWIDEYWDRIHPIAIQRFRNVALYPDVEAPTFQQHGGPIGAGFELVIAAPSGTVYYTTDGGDPLLPNGVPNPTARVYADPVPLNENTVVKARVLDNMRWSALTSARFVVNPATAANVTISEVQFHPPDADERFGDLPLDADEYEFVEIWNFGEEPVNLDGARFSSDGGIRFVFASRILDAGDRLVVVRNASAFAARYPDVTSVAPGSDGEGGAQGQYGGRLDNGGERLVLLDALGDVIASFDYDDSQPWPQRADGRGSSLELIDPFGDLGDPGNWRSSSDYGGSPGAAAATAVPTVVFNEVLTHTDPPDVDWIELHNVTDGSIDVGGWYMSDDDDDYFRFALPVGTSIDAGEYLVLSEADFNDPGNDNGFALNSTAGDDVWLLSVDSSGKPLTFVDHVRFGAAAEGESFGRWPDGMGSPYPMLAATPGGANRGPRIGPVVIGEIMYNPVAPPTVSESSDLEFVEIRNPTSEPVELSGWRLDGAVDFAFPDGLSFEPDSVIVIVPFDPLDPLDEARQDEFLSAYDVDPSIILLGPFTGRLDNAGETLRLLRAGAAPPEDPTAVPLLVEDEVRYDDASPWPESADGAGFSLTRRGAAAAWGNDPESWIATVATPGDRPRALRAVAVDLNLELVDPPDLAAPQPTSWQRQRSDVRSITITFSQSVAAVRAADVRLVNLGVNAPATADQDVFLTDDHLATRDNRVRISLQPGELPDGVYRLEVLDAVHDVLGNRLDGDRDETPGGTFVVTGDESNSLYQLSADFNGDGGISIFDFSTFAYWFGHAVSDLGAPSYVDLDRDAGVSIFDFAPFARSFGVGIEFPEAPLSGGAVTPLVIDPSERQRRAVEDESASSPAIPSASVVVTRAAPLSNEFRYRVGGVEDESWRQRAAHEDSPLDEIIDLLASARSGSDPVNRQFRSVFV